MDLFTIVMDFNGGTYVSQVRADDEIDALQAWSLNLNHKEISGLGEKLKSQIISEIETDSEVTKPVLLEGTINTWGTFFSIRGRKIFVHLVKTAQ
ncbi:hypothetical protein ACFST9_02340 [Hymenobacter monticola]|uniref:Uncharacterized protein n=1 Tax=Hymenobacter monticola TaxID=1705399 RepID=A0ABY4B231_9BACT|nr:hypothetical protein [Hymenobacter monticola]UOE33200.1 hypothetical protein MTP16_18990 [Hymenobacter monticola]